MRKRIFLLRSCIFKKIKFGQRLVWYTRVTNFQIYFSGKQRVSPMNSILHSRLISTRRVTSHRLLAPVQRRICHVQICSMNFLNGFSGKRSVTWKNCVYPSYFVTENHLNALFGHTLYILVLLHSGEKVRE